MTSTSTDVGIKFTVSCDYSSASTSMNNKYLKNYHDSYYTGEVFGGSYTGTVITPPKSIKDELLDLLRYDYQVGTVMREMMKQELIEALQNDYRVREIMQRAASSQFWQQEFVESVMLAIETNRTHAENNERVRERFNNMLIPVHKPKEGGNDRAVKLV